MDAKTGNEPAATKGRTTFDRTSERELVATRIINGPAHLVYEAWTRPELFERWWVPKSFGMTLLSCELDVRIGGKYRLVFKHEGSTMDFFGTYLDVVRNSRISWTNDEAGNSGSITTVTFQETDGKTLLRVHDLYPSKEALDDAIASGATSGLPETLDQLDELIVTQSATATLP
jgi:uncharacterized protein YndB with AHSA1/START domain